MTNDRDLNSNEFQTSSKNPLIHKVNWNFSSMSANYDECDLDENNDINEINTDHLFTITKKTSMMNYTVEETSKKNESFTTGNINRDSFIKESNRTSITISKKKMNPEIEEALLKNKTSEFSPNVPSLTIKDGSKFEKIKKCFVDEES